LFDGFAREVYAYARRRTGAADADDVVADTFAVVWRRLDDVPEQPRPWLLAVARNCLANHQRSARRRVALVDRLSLVPTADEPPDGSAPDLSDSVRHAFDALSVDAREVLALLAWEGLSPAEAAEVLDCTRAALYLRVHRARRHFAKELERQTDEHS
jgi:RNA polymerase sigma-70 factor (ECF subfamily)